MSGGTKSGPGRRVRGGGDPPTRGDALSGDVKGGKGPDGQGGGGPGEGPPADDPCDLGFVLDLVGVRAAVAATVSVGEVLDVVLAASDGYEAAVCRTRTDGARLGSLAAFEGLDQLLKCLRAGRRFAARVSEVERTRCRVEVGSVRA